MENLISNSSNGSKMSNFVKSSDQIMIKYEIDHKALA